ncbi:MAG: hypothetical protein AAB511_03665 [Patescibacteria group bacterium]
MNIFSKFWGWYNSHKTFNTGLAAGLFLLQLVHLYWLTTHVVFWKLFGVSLFDLTGVWQFLMIIVDYTEIPAIILTSIVYINEFREDRKMKSLLYLLFLNSQWLHIFWITDEFVMTQFTGAALVVMPVWLSWLAIGIDYLELPVIYDTIKKFLVSFAAPKKESTIS